MLPLLTALLLSQATIYSWTDKKGVQHFTDDLSSIPKGVKVRTTEGDVVSRIESEPAKPQQKQLAAAPVQPPPAPPKNDALAAEQHWRSLFREATRRVENLKEDIERDRKQVEEVNGMPLRAGYTCAMGWWGQPTMGTAVTVNGAPLTTTSTVSVLPGVAPCYYSLNPEFERVRERLESNRRELVRAKSDLEDLERRASFASVPREWRR